MYVNPDLSFQERKAQKELRNELTRRKKVWENDIHIHRGQIIIVKKSHQAQQEMDSSSQKNT